MLRSCIASESQRKQAKTHLETIIICALSSIGKYNSEIKFVDCRKCAKCYCQECARFSDDESDIIQKTLERLHWSCDDCIEIVLSVVKYTDNIEEKCKEVMDSARPEIEMVRSEYTKQIAMLQEQFT